jgi:hypothetical protein
MMTTLTVMKSSSIAPSHRPPAGARRAPQRHLASPRLVRIIFVLVAALALSACSAIRFGYNQGADLLYWRLNSYIDVNDQQQPQVRQALADWMQWHRQTELPKYSLLLAKAQGQMPGTITAAEVCEWRNEAQARVSAALAQAVPAAAALVITLTPDQLQFLDGKLLESDQEMREEFLQPDLAERERETIERTVGRAEMLYGSLDDAQKAQVADGVRASPFDPERWLAERRQRQLDLLATLRTVAQTELGDGTAAQAQAEAALRALVARTLTSPRTDFVAYQQALTRYNCEFAARIHNLTTPAQRQVASGKLEAWAGDATSLAMRTQR